jgi:hypothetical protein
MIIRCVITQGRSTHTLTSALWRDGGIVFCGCATCFFLHWFFSVWIYFKLFAPEFLFNSNKSPTWCNNFSVYYPDVCLQLNMFRPFSRPSSGARWLQWQPLVLPSYRGDSRAVFVIRPAGRSPYTYVNHRLQIQLELLMMSGMPLEHVKPSMNGGIINSITILHLVSNFSWDILRYTDPWILKNECLCSHHQWLFV